MRSMFTTCVVLLLAVVVLPGALGETPVALAQDGGDTAPYEIVDCPVEMPLPEARVECGRVTVPLDRDNPADGNLQIATMLMRSSAESPLADPVVYLDGGPGGTTLETAPLQFGALYEPFLAERDVVIFDQRGIGYSTPALTCDTLAQLEYNLLAEALELEEIRSRTLDAFTTCVEDLSASVDLADYNSTANGADVVDVLQALGYEEWNLYGISYGTMLAQYVLRDNPAGTRSVILDSNVPLTIDLFETIPSSFRRALDEMIAECEASETCNAAYPNLDAAIDDAYATLNAAPLEVEALDALGGETYTVIADGDVLMDAVFLALYSSGLTALVPRTIYEVLEGQTASLGILLTQQITQIPFGTPLMYGAVMCADEVPFNESAELDAASTDPALGDTLISFFAADVPTMFEACDTFGDTVEAQPLSDEAISSDVPALIVGGQFDPITPPEWSDILAEGFSNAFVYEFPASGHGATTETECAQEMMLAFLAEPTVEPDSSCIAEIAAPNFQVPTTELELVEVEVPSANVAILLPDDWTEISDGVYSPDGGQNFVVLVQRLPAPLSDAGTAYAEAFTEDGELPDVAELVETDALTWNLYELSIQGFPGTLALAEIAENDTVAVLLLTPSSDRDAFYELFLLPALEDLRPLE